MKKVRWGGLAAICCVFGVLACSGAGGESSSSPVQPLAVVSAFPQPDDSAAGAADTVSSTFDKNMNPASAGSFTVQGSLTGSFRAPTPEEARRS